MSVEVAFTAGQPSTARALILNSDSRAMSAAAADKVAALLRGAATFVPHWQVRRLTPRCAVIPAANWRQ